MPEPWAATVLSCVPASAKVKPAAAPGPASKGSDVHLPKGSCGPPEVLPAPHGSCLPGHHPWDTTTGASPPGWSSTGASLWRLHHQDITTKMLQHWLLVLCVPKALAGARADQLQLPSAWLGSRRGLPVGCRGSPDCNGAWCHTRSPNWRTLKLLPLPTGCSCGDSGVPSSSSSQAPHLHLTKRWRNLIILGAVSGFSRHTEKPTTLLSDLHIL